MDRYRQYLVRQVMQSGVKVRLNTEVTPRLILEIHPDHLIAAVGAVPVKPEIPGIEHAIGLLDYYIKDIPVGKKAVIIGGGLSGIEAAIELSQEGKTVTVIEMGERYAAGANLMHGFALDVEIRKYDIDVRLQTRCVRIEANHIICEDRDHQQYEITADTILYAAGMRSRTETVDSLIACCDSVSVIGDCAHPAQIMEAAAGGYNAAMSI